MKFCNKCGNILKISTENNERFLFCRTCNIKTKLGEKITIDTSFDKSKKEVIVITDGEEDTFPTTDILCPKCNEIRKAAWTMQQTRGGDEPPTRFYQCKTCNYRWREYS